VTQPTAELSQGKPATAMAEWPVVHDLEKCTFIYHGRTVDGGRLAALLGLTEQDLPQSQEHARNSLGVD
jgi:hypothetical protein